MAGTALRRRPEGGLAFGDTQRYAQYLGPQLDTVGATGAEGARIEQFDLLSSRLHWAEGLTVLLIVLMARFVTGL